MELDPLYVDPQNKNYHLQDGSPCIGAGRYDDDMGALPFDNTEIDVTESLPETVSLLTNYPNPFNAVTNIVVGLEEPANVNISIVNILGQKIETLYAGNLEVGRHVYNWDAQKQTSGMYFAVADINGVKKIKNMLLLK